MHDWGPLWSGIYPSLYPPNRVFFTTFASITFRLGTVINKLHEMRTGKHEQYKHLNMRYRKRNWQATRARLIHKFCMGLPRYPKFDAEENHPKKRIDQIDLGTRSLVTKSTCLDGNYIFLSSAFGPSYLASHSINEAQPFFIVFSSARSTLR